MELNIICVQLEPIHFNPLGSMEKVSKMLETCNNADIVVHLQGIVLTA